MAESISASRRDSFYNRNYKSLQAGGGYFYCSNDIIMQYVPCSVHKTRVRLILDLTTDLLLNIHNVIIFKLLYGPIHIRSHTLTFK